MENHSPDVQAAARRQAEVAGAPPRVAAKHTPEVVAAAREQLAKVAGAGSGNSVDIDSIPIPEMLLTVMCHRELFARLAEVSIQLLQRPALDKRDRQLVILRTAWVRRIPYIWGEHVRVSKALGISGEEIERVIAGVEAEGWDAYEKALLSATDELCASAMISDANWSILAQRLDDQQLFELTVLVGQFSTVGLFQNALRIPLAPGNPGLNAR